MIGRDESRRKGKEGERELETRDLRKEVGRERTREDEDGGIQSREGGEIGDETIESGDSSMGEEMVSRTVKTGDGSAAGSEASG